MEAAREQNKPAIGVDSDPDGVRIVRDERNRDLIPDAVDTRIKALRDSVVQGWITVPRQ